MDNEVYSFALKNMLNEIRNVCPDIISTFVFREDGEIIAGDENTPEKTIVRFVDVLDGILEKAEAVGGLECITAEGSNGRVNVSRMNDIYFATVTSRKADMTYVNTVTRVLIPTVLKLLDKICPTPLKSGSTLTKMKKEHETSTVNEFKKPIAKLSEDTVIEEPEETVEPQIGPEPLLLELPISQLIVEDLGGFLVPSDTVRVDGEILSRWGELCEGRKIEEVDIETFSGKKARQKVKPIEDSKYEGRGIIQMPKKVQSTLEIRKGELVRVKPVVV